MDGSSDQSTLEKILINSTELPHHRYSPFSQSASAGLNCDDKDRNSHFHFSKLESEDDWLLESAPYTTAQYLAPQFSSPCFPSPSSTSTSTSSLFSSDQTTSMVSLNQENQESAVLSHPTSVSGIAQAIVVASPPPGGTATGNVFSLEPAKSPLLTTAANRGAVEQIRGSRPGGAAGVDRRQIANTDKLMKSTDSRIRNTLKESTANSFPARIHLPDGEEMYWGKFKNFRLRTPEDDLAMMDTVIHPPPNVTVDHSVCENMYWNEGHRCQGDLNHNSAFPPSYGSQNGPWGVGDTFCSASSKLNSSSSSSSHETPSKSGKIKEVLSTFVRSVLPSSSRSSCRIKHDKLDDESRRKDEKDALSGRSKPDVQNRGSGPVMFNTRSVSARNAGLSANLFPGSPSTAGGSSLFGGANLPTNCAGTNAVQSSDPPPSYEKAIRDKKKEQKGKK
jgi:hypothetical protein